MVTNNQVLTELNKMKESEEINRLTTVVSTLGFIFTIWGSFAFTLASNQELLKTYNLNSEIGFAVLVAGIILLGLLAMVLLYKKHTLVGMKELCKVAVAFSIVYILTFFENWSTNLFLFISVLFIVYIFLFISLFLIGQQ